MNFDYFFIIAQNASLLITFALFYNYFWIQKAGQKNVLLNVISGFVIGFICIVLMRFPAKFSSGIIFDTRSVILSITGLFFGIIPSIIATLIAVIYRISLGGAGVYMGVAVIVTSSAIGLFWKIFRKNWKERRFIKELTVLSVLVHFLMMIYLILLPKDKIIPTLKDLWLPIFLVYIPATVLLGWFMLNQEMAYKNRLAEKKLFESEKRFRDILVKIRLFAVVLDKDLKIIFCNPYFIQISGYEFDFLKNISIDEIFYESNKRVISKDRVYSKLSLSSFEMSILTKDKTIIDVYWNIVEIRDENNLITGYAAIGENITERKKYEHQLQEAKLKAEESDRLKTAFLTNISHEIRTPLNSIIGFSELIYESESKQERKEFFEIIKYSSDKLLEIINDLLDISKLETNLLRIEKEYFYINDFLEKTFEIYKNDKLLNSKHLVALKVDIPNYIKDQVVYSDRSRIQQIINNLINNAIKYTTEGFIEFGAEISMINESKVYVFYVRDTGKGIPEKMLNIIFERFRQVEENDYRSGTGLGLSICKGIVELLGGQIWVESTLGKGSTFYFSIPFVDTDNIIESKLPAINNTPSLKIRNKTIIIAEDDMNSFYYLNALLNPDLNSLNIIWANNGKELLNFMETTNPDLILLDLNMGVMSGLESLKIIRKKNNLVKVIAQTAYASDSDREKCINAGCDEYISKPINRIELYNKIDKVFDLN